jgi:hypothetical protein
MAARENIKKPRRWLLPAILLLLFSVVIAIWFHIPSYLADRLTEYVNKTSGGLYSLTIGDMRRSFFPFSVTFSDVSLEPDTAEDNTGNQKNINYSFSADKIEINSISLKSLLQENIFSSDRVKIVKPAIKLEGEELLQVDSLHISERVLNNIWPLLGYVEEVRIKKIEFEEAQFGFYSAAGDSNFISQAQKVSIDILGFNSSSRMKGESGQLFTTEDVLIRMNHFIIDMGDSLHYTTIDTLLYSLKTTDIKVKNFSLKPYSLNSTINLFEVHVPEVYIKSRSITHFALSDSIKIRFLEFVHPGIRFYQKNNPEQLKLEDFNEFDLYSLVQQQFLKLEVDTFLLHDAHLEIFSQPQTDSYRQQFRSIDVILHGFSLDSASSKNRSKLFHADELEMQVEGYHLKLKDNEHHFKAQTIFVSTFTNRLTVEHLQIYPEQKKETNSRTLINIECIGANVEEVNFLDLYHKRILPAYKMELIEPDVHLLYQLDMEKRQKHQNSGLLYEVVADYMEGVYIDNVHIQNGRLDIRNNDNGVLKGYFETNFNFELTEFSLDSASVERSSNFFFASNFDLHFSDYSMRLVDDLHKIDVDNVIISGSSGQVQIQNLVLQPVYDNLNSAKMESLNHSELYRISVPEIILSDVDLNDAFFSQKLQISDFRINNPDIYFENFNALKPESDKTELSEIYQLLFNYMQDIDIRRFSVNNGYLTWINHTRQGETTSFDNEFSASLINFRLNNEELKKQRLLFSDNFEITIKDQEFGLSDNVHILKGSEISLSSARSSIKVKNALLFPLITSDRYNELATTWQVAIPEISIEGFNFHKAYYAQEPEIKLLEIINPKLQVYVQAENTKWLDSRSYQFPLPSFVESVKVDELKITGAEAISYKVKGLQHQARANFRFDFRMPGLLLKNNDQNQIQIISNNVLLSVSKFKSPIDDYHNLNIESIEYNRQKESIEVSEFIISPFISAAGQNLITVKAPQISFSGFNVKEAIDNNNFLFNLIAAPNPEIIIDINEAVNGDTLEFLQTLDLYPYVEHLVNRISINQLEVSDVNLNFSWLQKNFSHNRINLSFRDILLSENQPPQNLLNSREFSISTRGLSAKSNDGLYAFSADSLIYNSARHNVLLKNLSIKPLIEKRLFPLQDGFQRDVSEVEIAYVEFQNINEKRWLQEKILEADLLKIGPLTAELYRNKRFPFNHNQRPPWPQDLIRNLNQDFTFDSVKLMPSNIRYSELLSISDEPGVIEFNRLTLRGGRFSNVDKINREAGPLHIYAEAYLYDKSLLAVEFKFDLTDNDYKHSAKGTLGPLSLSLLNSMITKSATLAIVSGTLNHLEFDLSFNRKQARGELYAGYNDLKIAVLSYSGEELQRDRFTSFLANTLKINSNNTGGAPVSIINERDEERSVFHFWWKSLYSGIRTTIGI